VLNKIKLTPTVWLKINDSDPQGYF